MIAQKATVNIVLVDSTCQSLKNYVFEVTVTNKSTRKLIVQDTTFMKDRVGDPVGNLISPYFSKKTGDQYVFIDAIPRSGLRIPKIDTCLEKCCGGITLKKGQSLKFGVNILACCPLDSGLYKLSIGLRLPLWG